MTSYISYTYNVDFFKTWSHDMAYILGFYCGDGCITSDSPGYYRLVFRLHMKDIEVLEFIKNCINPNLNINKVDTIQKSGHVSHMGVVRISNQEICRDIFNMGFKLRKTYNMHLPDIPDEFCPDFLRGLFDADGSAEAKRKRARISCIDEDFLRKLSKKTVNCGKITRGHGSWDLCFNNMHDVMTLRDYMYNGNFHLDRKYQQFQLMEWREIPVYTAFGEEKTLMDWSRDERCCVTPDGLRYRAKQYLNVIPFEEILSSQFIVGNYPSHIAMSPDKKIYKIFNMRNLCQNYPKFTFLAGIDNKQYMSKSGWAIRKWKDDYEKWLITKRSWSKTRNRNHSLGDLKMMWDEEKIKSAPNITEYLNKSCSA